MEIKVYNLTTNFSLVMTIGELPPLSTKLSYWFAHSTKIVVRGSIEFVKYNLMEENYLYLFVKIANPELTHVTIPTLKLS